MNRKLCATSPQHIQELGTLWVGSQRDAEPLRPLPHLARLAESVPRRNDSAALDAAAAAVVGDALGVAKSRRRFRTPLETSSTENTGPECVQLPANLQPRDTKPIALACANTNTVKVDKPPKQASGGRLRKRTEPAGVQRQQDDATSTTAPPLAQEYERKHAVNEPPFVAERPPKGSG